MTGLYQLDLNNKLCYTSLSTPIIQSVAVTGTERQL